LEIQAITQTHQPVEAKRKFITRSCPIISRRGNDFADNTIQNDNRSQIFVTGHKPEIASRNASNIKKEARGQAHNDTVVIAA
jgi:hypothetical protein